MHKIKNPLLPLALVLLALLNVLPQLSTAFAQGTAFTYDGLLQKGSFPQNGTFNFTFTLFNVANNGTAIAGPITITGVTVKGGAFTATPDFGGAVWNGQTVWLEIGVEGPGDTSFTPLAPRQQIMPTPYAIYAESANNFSGTINNSQLANSSITVNPGSGLTGGGSVSLGGTTMLGIATGGVNNSMLANSTITVVTAPGSGLSGGTTVPLGGTLNLNNTGVTSLMGGDGVTVSARTGDLTLGLGSTLTLPSLPITINTDQGYFLYADNNGNYSVGASIGTPTPSGTGNTATGYTTLGHNTSGSYNTANGASALFNNVSAPGNTAVGYQALNGNRGGSYNVGDGFNVLFENMGGSYNTALGSSALWQLGQNGFNQGGTNNIALGYLAGSAFTGNESSNIDIGNIGVLGESGITRIGTPGIQTTAYIAGIITGNGSGLTGLNASQLTSGTINNSQLANSSITITPGSGLVGGGSVSLGSGTTLGIKPAGVDNTLLANPNITIITGAGLNGGGTFALGGQITLSSSGVTSLTGSDGVTVTGTGDLTLGLGSTLTLANLPVAINSGNGSVLYADNNGNYFAGFGAGNQSTSGSGNTANGLNALLSNTTGSFNIANGNYALFQNTTGSYNTANGVNALSENSSGSQNTANGSHALLLNQTGSFNVGDGANALTANHGGSYNTALGYSALGQLGQTTPTQGGTNNIALGYAAGSGFIGNESSNIDIGNPGFSGENNIIRIGTPGIQTAAYIAGVITGDGSGLVNLNASQITGGTINSSQLANSFITVTTGPGLSGGTSVSLDDGTLNLINTGVTSLTGGGGVTVSASSGAVTLGSTATSSDTANAIVSRDGSGNFSAGTITLYSTLNFVTNVAIGNNGVLDANTIGHYNIGIGNAALLNSKTGSNNIAIGNGTLLLTSGSQNDIAIGNEALQDGMEDNVIAIGNQSLESANFGIADTALGQQALQFTTFGSYNTAVGYQVMQNLINVSDDTAVGYQALQGGATEGPEPNNAGNTAVGFQALQQTAYAVNNTGVGVQALLNNTNGNNNTGIGASALAGATNGNYNIAVGNGAGSNLKTGDNNIDIGNAGVTTETGIIRIGTPGNQTAAYLAGVCNATAGYGCQQGTSGGSFGHTFNFWWTGTQLQAWVDTTDVGVVSLTSDQRLKENIEPMTDDALTRVMALRPSTFNYKNIPGTIFQGDGQTQEGFIADELQQVIPSAVNGQKDGLTPKGNIQPQTVNLMPVVAVLTKAVQDQQKEMLDQQKEINELKAMVKTLSEKK